ncbi:MAG: cyanase [Opitutales bacterium]|nr:cyanase [Opitutales bacterium]
MTEIILAAKAKKKATWQALAESVGLTDVFLVSACLGQNSLPAEHADKLCEALDLAPAVSAALQEFPTKGMDPALLQDPVIYRLQEIVYVYGPSIKAVIHEKLGDGIMSAIDFSMHIDKEPNPAGDRVNIRLSGKFLPYKRW